MNVLADVSFIQKEKDSRINGEESVYNGRHEGQGSNVVLCIKNVPKKSYICFGLD